MSLSRRYLVRRALRSSFDKRVRPRPKLSLAHRLWAIFKPLCQRDLKQMVRAAARYEFLNGYPPHWGELNDELEIPHDDHFGRLYQRCHALGYLRYTTRPPHHYAFNTVNEATAAGRRFAGLPESPPLPGPRSRPSSLARLMAC